MYTQVSNHLHSLGNWMRARGLTTGLSLSSVLGQSFIYSLFDKSYLFEIELIQMDVVEMKIFQLDLSINRLFGKSNSISKSKNS